MPPIDTATLLATVLADLGGPLLSLAPPTAAPAADTMLSGERGTAFLGAAFFALLTIALTVWLHKKIRPDLLTPANAHHAFTDEPTQPGGAPSA